MQSIQCYCVDTCRLNVKMFFHLAEMLEPRSRGGGGGGKSSGDGKIGTGRETLRLRSKGPATVEEMVTVFSQCCDSEYIFYYSRWKLRTLSQKFEIQLIFHISWWKQSYICNNITRSLIVLRVLMTFN